VGRGFGFSPDPEGGNMAALTTQNLGAGGAYTLAAAAGGGDTIESSQVAGGWGQHVALVASVGATATTITLDGTAFGPYTSQTVVIPVPNGVKGSRKNITYNQVASVTVGAVQVGSPNAYGTYGT
jgi:hypothetical protein